MKGGRKRKMFQEERKEKQEQAEKQIKKGGEEREMDRKIEC